MSNRPKPIIRSYEVVWSVHYDPRIVPSVWQPGYTPAHQPTEELAIQYAEAQLDRQRRNLQYKAEALQKLRQDNGCHHGV